MKISEYTNTYGGVVKNIELHLEYSDDDGCFVLAEIDKANGEVETSISFEWPEAEKIERFLTAERKDADARDQEWGDTAA